MADRIFRNLPYKGYGSWQEPVTTAANLPTFGNDAGDVRVTQDTGDFYEWNGSAWMLVGGPSFPSGIVSLNGLTVPTQFFATGTIGSDFNIVSAVATHTFNIPDAGTSARGVVTNVAQTFGGLKSFNNGIKILPFSSSGAVVNDSTGLLSSASGTLGQLLQANGASPPSFVSTSTITGIIHANLSGLAADDHLQYLLLAGRVGGQTAIGGTTASNNLILRSTSNVTKGQVYLDETTDSSGITTGALRVDGGVGIGQSLSVGNKIRLQNVADFQIEQYTVNTTDATLTNLASISIPTDSCMMIEAYVIARRTGGSAGSAGDSAAYIRITRMKNVAGTVTEHNTQTSFTSEDIVAYNATFNVSGTNALVQVTGVANTNITWQATVKRYLIS